MNREIIIRKLTSRKFWLALISFITLLCTACGIAEDTAAQVGAIVMAGATVIAYIFGEGFVDAEKEDET